MTKYKFADEELMAVAAAYHETGSLRRTAKALDCGIEAVKGALDRAGVRTWKAGNRGKSLPPGLMVRLGEQWRSGRSIRELAADLPVSAKFLQRVLRQAGYGPKGPYRAGSGSNRWKGGRIETGGYVLVVIQPEHPFAEMRYRSGYVPEHRLVVAESIGRPLDRSETVHHINGDTRDNRIANLQLRRSRHGKGAVFTCGDCGSHNILARPLAEATGTQG